MVERFGSVGFPALAAISIVWFLYSYIEAHLKANLAGEDKAELTTPPRAAAIDPSWVRDVSLLDALWRAHLGEWNARKEYPRDNWEVKKPFHKVTGDIRQKAFEGALPVWARRPSSNLFEPLPRDFWRNHALEAEYCVIPGVTDAWVKVTHPIVVGEVPHARTAVWTDFMTSKHAVETLWPAPSACRAE